MSSFQIATSIPLVSDRQDLSVLKREYAEDDSVYQLKIKVRAAPFTGAEFTGEKQNTFMTPNLPGLICPTGSAQKVLVYPENAAGRELFLQSLRLLTFGVSSG